MPNSEESDEHPNQGPYQKELAHKTRLMFIRDQDAPQQRPARNRIGEASGRQEDIWGPVVG